MAFLQVQLLAGMHFTQLNYFRMKQFSKYKAATCDFQIIMSSDNSLPVHPDLRDANGDKLMWSVSIEHGRSFVVNKTVDNRYIITKGNGLSYSTASFLNTSEFGDDTWGLLLKKDAIRDFTLGKEIEALGIVTNKMEYVLELQSEINLPNGHIVKPVILQYSVKCPYRISDAAFMRKDDMANAVDKWEAFNTAGHEAKYLIAAEVLIKNLRILHDNNVLHNAIHAQNYTWALELLDFELACSPKTPYEREDYQRHAIDLFPREIMQTYQVINYIACALGEKINFSQVDNLFKSYGFDIGNFVCKFA